MISILIVNYNTGKILKDCISSIYKFEQGESFELILIDNNSTDDTKDIIEQIASEKKNVKTIFLKEDQGFSFANNRGFEVSSGEYILIMNPDIIFTEQIFEKLIENFTDNPEMGAVSPLLIGTDGKFQRNYFQRYPTITQFILFYSFIAKPFFKFPRLVNRYLMNLVINPESGKLEFTEQIPCAFFFTTRKIFEQASKMDESYVLFFEDVDLSFQINKKNKLAVDTRLSVTHLGGISFRSKDNWWMHGRFILSMINFFDKNYIPLKSLMLKIIIVKNSLLILCFEYLKKIFGGSDEYRIKKHKYFLAEFKNRYL